MFFLSSTLQCIFNVAPENLYLPCVRFQMLSVVAFDILYIYLSLCLQKTRSTLRSSVGLLCGSWKRRTAICALKKNANVRKRSYASSTLNEAGVSGDTHPPHHTFPKGSPPLLSLSWFGWSHPGKPPSATYKWRSSLNAESVGKWLSVLQWLNVSMFRGMYVPLCNCGWHHECILVCLCDTWT